MAIRYTMRHWGKGIARETRQSGRKLWFWGVAALIGWILAGCATYPGGGVTAESPPEVKQKVVMERAKARWQAVMQQNVEQAYGFLSPGSKATTPLAVYGGKARFKGIKSANILSAVCEAETCKVRADVVLEHRLMKSIPFELEENWVLENGQYWYVWRP